MKYYKLTDSNGQTHGGTQWGEGISHKANGEGKQLCSSDAIHVYDHPFKAALFNSAHANFSNPILWECKVRKVLADDGLKIGVKECMTLRQIPLPAFTLTQQVAFAILVAKQVYTEASFVKWADNWLDETDRTARAAAAWAASAAARAAASAAAWAASAAARAAASAAAEEATEAVAEAAASAAAWAARAAAWAAEAARKIDFVTIAKQALRY